MIASDNFCLFFGAFGALTRLNPLQALEDLFAAVQDNPRKAQEWIARQKGWQAGNRDSEHVAQLKLQGLGKQVALLSEVGEIEKAYVVVDAV